MLKRYKFWLTAAVVVMFLAAGLHSISFFVSPDLQNDTQRQLHELMHNYREDLGAGFMRSTWDLFTALSACYPLLCVLGGATLGFMMLKHAGPEFMRGLIAINLTVFAVCLVVMVVFTFLPPIIVTGLIVLNLLVAFLLCPKPEAAS